MQAFPEGTPFLLAFSAIELRELNIRWSFSWWLSACAGSGKTTLIECLSLRNRNFDVRQIRTHRQLLMSPLYTMLRIGPAIAVIQRCAMPPCETPDMPQTLTPCALSF
jgi:hypothetical protein